LTLFGRREKKKGRERGTSNLRILGKEGRRGGGARGRVGPTEGKGRGRIGGREERGVSTFSRKRKKKKKKRKRGYFSPKRRKKGERYGKGIEGKGHFYPGRKGRKKSLWGKKKKGSSSTKRGGKEAFCVANGRGGVGRGGRKGRRKDSARPPQGGRGKRRKKCRGLVPGGEKKEKGRGGARTGRSTPQPGREKKKKQEKGKGRARGGGRRFLWSAAERRRGEGGLRAERRGREKKGEGRGEEPSLLLPIGKRGERML